jgi:hypothetical protein
MQHPFITDLSNKTLEELQETVSGLMSKLTFAYRTGNGPLIHQLHMALESYKAEHGRKIYELIKKQNINTKIDIKKENER